MKLFPAIVALIVLIMPPKIGTHGQAAEKVAAKMYGVLSSETGGEGQARFGDAVCAFADLPKVSSALGFTSGTTSVDIATGAVLLQEMKHSFETTLSANGARYAGARSIAESTASTICGEGLNLASVKRVTGISADVMKKGAELKLANSSKHPSAASSSVPVTHADTYPLERVWDWYHRSECTRVAVNKQTKRKYARKKFRLPNGAELDLTCDHRIRYGSKAELAQSYMDSKCHAAVVAENPRRKICLQTAQECICDCMKECTNLESICPFCTGFKYKLAAWHKMRSEARKTETCDCPECIEGSPWRDASSGLSAWRLATTCGKVEHPDLTNPADGTVPMLNLLRCSLLLKPKTRKRQRETEGTEEAGKPDVYPPFAGGPCGDCGLGKIAPSNCSVEMSSKTCIWIEKQDEKGPRGEALYTERTGTRKELLELTKQEGMVFNYHMWTNQWVTHQHALDNETFDGAEEINITTDYGAVYDMQQAVTEKCSHGTSCNQLVALVLHSPGERRTGNISSSSSSSSMAPGPRPVICDVWRIWSQKKGNATFHQMAMKEIATHYKEEGIVPGLKRAKVKSDGQRAQYKGHKNLGAVAEWPHPRISADVCKGIDCLCRPGGLACNITNMKPGQGLEMFHDFSVSHHGSGPVDNYSKDTRRGMDLDVAAGKFTRYNYEHCFDWCVNPENNMSAPSDAKKHLGTFGANGKYIYRAYSDGKDPNLRGFPVIPTDRSFQPLSGSNELYAYRAKHSFLPQIEALFVPCYCINCRSGKAHLCKYRQVTHSTVSGGAAEVFTTHEVACKARGGGSDSE